MKELRDLLEGKLYKEEEKLRSHHSSTNSHIDGSIPHLQVPTY